MCDEWKFKTQLKNLHFFHSLHTAASIIIISCGCIHYFDQFKWVQQIDDAFHFIHSNVQMHSLDSHWLLLCLSTQHKFKSFIFLNSIWDSPLSSLLSYLFISFFLLFFLVCDSPTFYFCRINILLLLTSLWFIFLKMRVWFDIFTRVCVRERVRVALSTDEWFNLWYSDETSTNRR